MGTHRFLISLSICFLFCCKTSEEKILLKFRELHADISYGYFGGDAPLFLVHSGCSASKEELLVFLHGSPGSWRDYEKYLLSDKLRSRYCIVVFDRPGYGKSNPEHSVPDISLQAHAIQNSLDDFFNRHSRKFSQKIFVGHSYGGPIAASILSGGDSRSIQLVLISAPMNPDLEEVRWYNRLASFALMQWILPKDLNHSNEEMLPLRSQLEELSRNLKIQKSRVLLIHGMDDFLVPFANVDFMKKKIPISLLNSLEIANENHFIPWTKFEFVEDALMNLK